MAFNKRAGRFMWGSRTRVQAPVCTPAKQSLPTASLAGPMARPSLWVTERDRQIWVARANGATFADIGAHFGITAGRAWEVDRNVQCRINARMKVLQFGYRLNALEAPMAPSATGDPRTA